MVTLSSGGDFSMGSRHLLKHLEPESAPVLSPVGASDDSASIILVRPIMFIGDRADAHIRITTPGMGSLHAVLIVQPGSVWIRDLASRSGTFVNDAPVREHRLRNGNRLRIGAVSYIFHCQQMTPEARHAPLVFQAGSGQQVEWSGRVLTIGRRDGSDLRLDHADVSLTHAIICLIGGRCYLRDAGSRTGTYVNRVRVRQIELLPTDVIEIAGIPIRAITPAAPPAPAPAREAAPPPLVANDLSPVPSLDEAQTFIEDRSAPPSSPDPPPVPEPSPATAQPSVDPVSASLELPIPEVIDFNSQDPAFLTPPPDERDVGEIEPAAAPDAPTPPLIETVSPGVARPIEEPGHELDLAFLDLLELEDPSGDGSNDSNAAKDDVAPATSLPREYAAGAPPPTPLPDPSAERPKKHSALSNRRRDVMDLELPADMLADSAPLPLFIPKPDDKAVPSAPKKWWQSKRRG